MRYQYPDKKPLNIIHSRLVWLALTENWIYNQIYYLPNWIKSNIICEKTNNLEQYSLPSIYVFPNISRLHFFLKYGLSELCIRRRPAFIAWIAKSEKANILHSHFGFDGWMNIKAAKQAGLKHVVTFYGVDASRLPKSDPIWIGRYSELFDQADCILCEGPHMAKCLMELGCPQTKVRVHHLGINVDNMAFKPRVWQPNEPLRILIAASFREKKGIPYALEALVKLQRDIPLEITIIGDASSEPSSQEEKKRILATIEKYNLSKVRLLGYQPHAVFLKEAYKHHIFLSPSITADDGDTEGGAPVSIIEMTASGMPVVSTLHCDIPEVIQNGKTGLLTQERNIEGLVKNLNWLIDNPRQWKPMVIAGRERVKVEFNAKIQGDKLASIYTELMAS